MFYLLTNKHWNYDIMVYLISSIDIWYNDNENEFEIMVQKIYKLVILTREKKYRVIIKCYCIFLVFFHTSDNTIHEVEIDVIWLSKTTFYSTLKYVQ